MKLGWPSLISCVDSPIGPTIIFSLHNYFGPCKLGNHHIDYHNSHWLVLWEALLSSIPFCEMIGAINFCWMDSIFYVELCRPLGLQLNNVWPLQWGLLLMWWYCMALELFLCKWIDFFLKSWQVSWILLVSGHFRMMYL